MMRRSGREMGILAAKLKDQIGPIDKWSDAGLETLTQWLAEFHAELGKELAMRAGVADKNLVVKLVGRTTQARPAGRLG